MRALLLLLLLLAASGYAVLSGSFCGALRDVAISSPSSPPTVRFKLAQICLTFVNDSYHKLSLSGLITPPAGGDIPSSAICTGTYSFAAPQEINFAYDMNTFGFCSSTTSGYSYCNWGCGLFGGTFIPFFDQAAAPTRLSITPQDPLANPPVNWGNLPFSMALYCNTSSCGSAENLIPNVQSTPSTLNVTVRRSHS